MRRFLGAFIGIAILGQVISAASAQVVADSIGEYSGVQGANSWSYGFLNKSNVPGESTDFTPFDSFSAGIWKSSDAQIPGALDNNDFLSLNALGGHPNGIGLGQDRKLWAIRRYTSEVSGPIKISFDLGKENVANPLGGGITGHILVDGVSIFDQFIANTDAVGVQGNLLTNVSIGATIDFAIDSLGVPPSASTEDPYSARADGSRFSAVISVPEPGSLAMLGLVGLSLIRRAPAR